MTAPVAGYSGTPLAKKLGFKPGMRVGFNAMPDSVRAEIDPAGIGVSECATMEARLDAAHVFVTTRAELARLATHLRTAIAPSGFIWISWPKKASKQPTDITEDVIREVILPMGLVDVKVCAIDAVWSGLKLMIRRELRSPK
ncbi:MAG: DUF3052 domain-containing protein [Sphingomonas sp.]|uniref:hypothetical protein n=1 Tax=Sphingomonas sp. TaxID=28214 RepID=UPI0035A87CF2|nr:DUF3052 domain-containing protein [Sphingomonas sp.]